MTTHVGGNLTRSGRLMIPEGRVEYNVPMRWLRIKLGNGGWLMTVIALG